MGLPSLMDCLGDKSAPGGSGRRTAAQMGMQVMHWEKMGVMNVFNAASEDAARLQLQQLLDRTPSLIHPTEPSRDNVGAALFHWAVIHRGVFQNANAAVVVDYLLTHHAQEVCNVYYRQYDDRIGLFDGESALHLSVAFSDLDLVKRLLAAGADPASRAYGTFFHPSGSCYFGEYPLSFAIACGSVEMAELLVADGRDDLLTNRDSFGNTALHIATIHRRKELVDWVLDRLESQLGIPKQQALNTHGASGLTPLGLAAVLTHNDDGQMFDFILNRMSRIEWVFGRVTCTSVPLEQIDTIPLKDGEMAYVPTLALVLCRRVYGLSTHPHLVGVMEAKWEQFGKISFLGAGAFHFVRLVFMTWLASAYGEGRRWMEDNNVTVAKEEELDMLFGNGTDAVAFESYEHYDTLRMLEWVLFVDCVLQTVIVLLDIFAAAADHRTWGRVIKRHARDGVACPPFLQQQEQGTSLWGQLTSSVNFMNLSPHHFAGFVDRHVPLSEYDFFAWVGQLCIIAHFVWFETTHIPNTSGTALISVSMLTIWMSTLKFTGFSRNLGMLSAIVFRTIKSDVTSFTVVFTVFLLGFGTAIHIIHGDERSYAATLDALAKTALGDTSEFASWSKSDEDMLSIMNYVLHLWFAICALVILLNLLISIFSCTFQMIQTQSEREWRLAKGRSVLLFERRLRLLCPFFEDSMRVNHFDPRDAGIELDGAPNDQHRYVFMTEAPDDDPDREENKQIESMRGVLGEVLSEHARRQRSGSGRLTRKISSDVVDLGKRAVDLEDVSLQGLSDEVRSGSGGRLASDLLPQPQPCPRLPLNGGGGDHGGGGALKIVVDVPADNPAFRSPTVESLADSNAPLLRGGSNGFSTSPLQVSMNPLIKLSAPAQAFDETQGYGTWDAFLRWTEAEFGPEPAFDRLSRHDILSLLTLFFSADTPQAQIQHCAEELYCWAHAQNHTPTPPSLRNGHGHG